MGYIIKDSTCAQKTSRSPPSLDSRFITPPIKKSKFCFPFILIKQQEFPGGSADKPNCSQLEIVGLVPVMRFLTLSLPISLLTLQRGAGLQVWVTTEIFRFSGEQRFVRTLARLWAIDLGLMIYWQLISEICVFQARVKVWLFFFFLEWMVNQVRLWSPWRTKASSWCALKF